MHENPFANAVGKSKVKRRHKTTLLNKLKANKATNNGDPKNNRAADSPKVHALAGCNHKGMDVDNPTDLLAIP